MTTDTANTTPQFITDIRQPMRQFSEEMQKPFEELPLSIQVEIDQMIQFTFLHLPVFMECALEALQNRRAELSIDSLAGLLAEGFASIFYVAPAQRDEQVEAAIEEVYRANLGMSRQEAIEHMVEIASIKFPEIRNEIVHEYGRRIRAKEAERQLPGEMKTLLMS